MLNPTEAKRDRICIIGGAGYKGTVLVNYLLQEGWWIDVIDTCWFGDYLPQGAYRETGQLRVIKADLRGYDDFRGKAYGAVIHLANIANDPCGELDAKLTWEVNVLETVFLCEKLIKAGIKRLIFASSASVYGIKDNKPVKEDADMAPVSDYNKSKMCAERVLQSYQGRLNVQIVRPATICGYSPRMRLDVVVNALTIQALTKGYIEVQTPDLMRPHCHILDAARLYEWLLLNPDNRGPYNAGFVNQTIIQTAQIIGKLVGCEVRVAKHVPNKYDKRSYCVDSNLLLGLGFKPLYKINDAVADIVQAYRDGRLKDEQKHYNLAHMRAQGLLNVAA